MAGLVVTKTGTGGITINIPLQFETIDHLAKVIIDDLTAGAGSGPNPHQDAIQLPATLKTLTDMVSGDFSALPATIDATTQTLMDTAQAAVQDITNGAGVAATAEAAASNVNATIRDNMLALNAFVTAADFGAAQTAMGAFAPDASRLAMGGVMQTMTNMEQFLNTTQNMSTNGSVGTAIQQLNDIAKNAGTLGAAGALATALASDVGLTAPPAINDAFTELQDGEAFGQVRAIAEGMKAVKNVIDLGSVSGHMDDMNDVVWQSTPTGPVTAASGTYQGQQVMQIACAQALANNLTPTDGQPGIVNVPGWTNPNTGAAEYIPTTPLAESLGTIQTNLQNKAASIQAKVVASLAPIEELTSAIGLAVSSGNLPAALDGALSGAVKTAMAAAKADVAANPHVDPTPPAGAPPDEGGGGRPK
jgi:hypothetical protein